MRFKALRLSSPKIEKTLLGGRTLGCSGERVGLAISLGVPLGGPRTNMVRRTKANPLEWRRLSRLRLPVRKSLSRHICTALLHSFSTHFVENHEDTPTLQEFLTDTNLQTTMIHTHVAGKIFFR
ncbi:MAG: hypothetical protein QXS68_08540 [Candidatus Methanomethylicaceae archaeon]